MGVEGGGGIWKSTRRNRKESLMIGQDRSS